VTTSASRERSERLATEGMDMSTSLLKRCWNCGEYVREGVHIETLSLDCEARYHMDDEEA
jgi:ribosomal protein L32